MPQENTNQGGGTSGPSLSTEHVQEQVKDVWSNHGAPEWVKSQGLTKAHDAGEQTTQTQKPQVSIATQVEPTQASSVAQTRAETAATSQAVQTQQAQSAAVTQAAQPQPLTAETIAAAVAAGIRPLIPQAPAPSVAQLTDAEIAQQLGIFTATPETYQAILGIEPTAEQVTALNTALQAIAKQAVTISSIQLQKQMQDFQRSMNPYVEAVRSREAENQRSLFTQEAPDLKGYEPLVEKVFNEALAQGRRFPDVASARKFVAEATRGLLKSINITPSPGGQSAPAAGAPQSPARRQMTTTAVGGRTGGTSAAGKPSNSVEAVWGKQ